MKRVLFFFVCVSIFWCGPAFAQIAEGGSGGEIAIPDIPGTSEAGSIHAPVIPDLGESDIPDIFPSQPEAPFLPTPAPGQAETPADWGTPDGMAEFERFLTGSLPEEQLTRIHRYGSEFFRTAPSTFAPDDAIVVPQKIESYRGLRQTRDYIDIIYKVAVTALSIHNITN